MAHDTDVVPMIYEERSVTHAGEEVIDDRTLGPATFY